MPVMHPRAPSSATRSWPTKVATLLFSGSLASLAILHAGSSACSPATPQPAPPTVVEVTKVEPPAAPPPAAPPPAAPPPAAPALNPPPPNPPPASPPPASPPPVSPKPAIKKAVEDPLPRRYLGGSKSAAVFEPDLAPQTQNNAEPQGAR